MVVVIDVDAYTATVGSTVGHATSSTFAGTMKCLRLARVVPYEMSTLTCYADYACINV